MVKNIFYKIFLSLILLSIAILTLAVQNLDLTVLSCIFAIMFIIKIIYEYKTPKKDRIPLIGIFDSILFVAMLLLGFVLLLQTILSWTYNPFLSILYGLLGLLFIITSLYDRKIR